jgi:hypothetical protein
MGCVCKWDAQEVEQGVGMHAHLSMLTSSAGTGASGVLGGSGKSGTVEAGAGGCSGKVENVGIDRGSPLSCCLAPK